MSINKIKVHMFLLLLFLCFLPYNRTVQAASTTEVNSSTLNQLPDQSNVSVNKAWTITFTGPITWNQIDGINIQNASTFIPINVNKISNNSLSITPVIFYEANSKYTLKIFLKNGRKYSLDFTTEAMNTAVNSRPRILGVQYRDDGNIYVKFDKAIDKETAFITSNWELNGEKISNLGFKTSDFDISSDNTTVELKNLKRYIDVGSNIISIHSGIKDSYGNSVESDTIKSFEYIPYNIATP